MQENTQTSRSLLMQKRKKRKRKKRLAFLAVSACLAALAAGIFFTEKASGASSEAVSIEAGEGEALTYARIEEIVGNEVQVSLLEQEALLEQEIREPNSLEQPAASMPPTTQTSASYKETGESRSWQIPVCTEVTTALGVTTTFSRLAAGNVIAVLTGSGTDNILKIWIVR